MKIGASVEQMPSQHKKAATAQEKIFFYILSFAQVLSNVPTYMQNKRTGCVHALPGWSVEKNFYPGADWCILSGVSKKRTTHECVQRRHSIAAAMHVFGFGSK